MVTSIQNLNNDENPDVFNILNDLQKLNLDNEKFEYEENCETIEETLRKIHEEKILINQMLDIKKERSNSQEYNDNFKVQNYENLMQFEDKKMVEFKNHLANSPDNKTSNLDDEELFQKQLDSPEDKLDQNSQATGGDVDYADKHLYIRMRSDLTYNSFLKNRAF